jgi:hypothetical protein
MYCVLQATEKDVLQVRASHQIQLRLCSERLCQHTTSWVDICMSMSLMQQAHQACFGPNCWANLPGVIMMPDTLWPTEHDALTHVVCGTSFPRAIRVLLCVLIDLKPWCNVAAPGDMCRRLCVTASGRAVRLHARATTRSRASA